MADPTADEVVNQNGSNAPVMTLTGARIPHGIGNITVYVLDTGGPLRFRWEAGGGVGNSTGQVMFPGGAEVPVPLANEYPGAGPAEVGLAVTWSGGDPYVNDDTWLFEDVGPSGATPTLTSAPPTVAAVGEPSFNGAVMVDVTHGAPGYLFRYTLEGSAPRSTTMARGTAVQLLDAGGAPSGLVITWPNVTTLYAGASYSWTVTPPALAMTGPGAGVELVRGVPVSITWTSNDGAVPNVALEVSTDDGSTWSTLAASVANTGSYSWTPSTSLRLTESARVRVSDSTDGTPESMSEAFTLKGLELTAPAGGATLTGGTTSAITWASAGLYPRGVDLELSMDGGAAWHRIAEALDDSGSYAWWVPITTASSVMVRVVDAEDPSISGGSATPFSIIRAMYTPHARTLKALLPPGKLWTAEGDITLSHSLHAIGDEFARAQERIGRVRDEVDPRTATELLDSWERLLGLPDADVQEIPATVEARRLAILSKLLRVGGQSPAYFIQLCAAAGYPGATVRDDYGLTVARIGAGVGVPLNGESWAHYWTVTVPAPVGAALSPVELEAILNRARPAHTVLAVIFL